MRACASLSVVLLGALLLSACGGADAPERDATGATPAPPTETTEETTLVLQENIDALANRITLPIRPESAAWIDVPLGNPNNRVPGPTDHRLDALLTYSSEGTSELMKLVGGDEAGKRKSVALEEWYPAEFAELARDGRLAVVEYPANAFVASPFTSGTIARVGETDHYLLTLLSF